jgi:hypothetical protein
MGKGNVKVMYGHKGDSNYGQSPTMVIVLLS